MRNLTMVIGVAAISLGGAACAYNPRPVPVDASRVDADQPLGAHDGHRGLRMAGRHQTRSLAHRHLRRRQCDVAEHGIPDLRGSLGLAIHQDVPREQTDDDAVMDDHERVEVLQEARAASSVAGAARRGV